MLSIKNIRRFTILFFILSITNFLGLLDTETTTLIIPLKDYGLLLVMGYVVFLHHFTKIKTTTILQIVFLFLLFVVFLIFTMPLRGDISLLNSFKTGRLFLIFLFSFVIYDEVLYSKDTRWIYNVILSIAYYFTILVFLNIFFPNFLHNFFVSGSAEEWESAWGMEGTTRHIIKGNPGILFIYIGFIIAFFEYFGKSKGKKGLVKLLFFFLGMVLQGWRAPLFATIFAVIVVYLINNRATRFLKIFIYIFFAISILLLMEVFSSNKFFSAKIVSSYNELTGESIGSFQGRLDRAQLYQIPMFKESKWLGYGFVNKESGLAKSLNNTGERPYNLYDFDFGYVTLLNYFGIIGLTLFMGMLLYIAFKLWKQIRQQGENIWLQVLLTWIIVLISINYSFGGLVSYIGLLPLSIIIGIGQWQILDQRLDK